MSRPKIPLGGDALSNAIRWLLEQDERRKIIKSPDVAPEETVRGTALRINAVKGGTTTSEPSTIQRFKVTQVLDDYVLGYKINASQVAETGTIIAIAKPLSLRVSYSDPPAGFTSVSGALGNSRVLTYTGATVGDLISGMTVNEILHPLYGVDDVEMYAVEPTGGLGFATTGLEYGGQRITWLDLNIRARHFRTQYLGTTVCNNSVQKRVVVAGGPLGATVV